MEIRNNYYTYDAILCSLTYYIFEFFLSDVHLN